MAKLANPNNDYLQIFECKCGKKFIPRPNWMYKIRTRNKTTYYCSYTCYHNDGGDNGNKIARY